MHNIFTTLKSYFATHPWLGRGASLEASKAHESTVPTTVVAKPQGDTAVPRNVSGLTYPPTDPGLPVGTVDMHLEGLQDLIRRLKIHAAKSDPIFSERFLAPIHRVAEYTGALPASAASNFAAPGGLLRASVELAFLSFQASDSRIFTGQSGVEERHALEIRWRYICFLAGLLWPLGKSLEAVSVRTADGQTWLSRVEPLMNWANRHNASSLYVQWPIQDIEPGPSTSVATIIYHVIGETNLTWIEEASPKLLNALIGIVGGQKNDLNSFAYDIVKMMWTKLTVADKARSAQQYGQASFGSHMAPQIVDLMSGLLSNEVWKINDSALLVDSHGVFLLWPTACEELAAEATRKGIRGLPDSPQAWTTAMDSAGLIESDRFKGPYIEVITPDGEITTAIQIKSPFTIVVDYNPGDYADRPTVTRRPGQPAPSKQPSSPAPASPPAKKGEVQHPDNAASKAPPVNNPPSTPAAPTPAPQEREPDGRTNPEVDEMTPPAPGVFSFKTTLPVSKPAAPESVASEQVEKPQPVPTATPSPQSAPLAPTQSTASTSSASPPDAAETEKVSKEIVYSDDLPPDVVRKLDPQSREVLGKIIRTWKDKTHSGNMRIQNDGCLAISRDLMTTITLNDIQFSDQLSKNGWLQMDINKPGLRLHERRMEDGSKKYCYLISRVLLKQVGINVESA